MQRERPLPGPGNSRAPSTTVVDIGNLRSLWKMFSDDCDGEAIIGLEA